MPNVVIQTCKSIKESNEFVTKCVARKFGFVNISAIALRQLNSLTKIDMFSQLDDQEVTHPTGVRDVPGRFPALARIFTFDFVVCCCVFRRKLSKLGFDPHFCIMTSVWDFSNPPFYWMIS